MSVLVRSSRAASLRAISITACFCALLSACSDDSDGRGPPIGSELDGAVLVINEVLANEAGSDVTREFVELVNVGDQSADIGGFTLSDRAGVRHEFALDTTLGPNRALVVFGGAAGIPGGVGPAVPASTGALGLSNGSDEVTLADGSGQLIDSVSYTGSLSSQDGVSMNRSTDGDPSADMVLHSELSDASSSPGTRVDGSGFEEEDDGSDGSDGDSSDDGDSGDGDDGDGDGDDGDPPPEGARFRVVAANLTSGNFQNYDPGHGIRILQGLAPDVAMVSEMNFGSDSSADIRSFVDQAFGPEFEFTRQDGVNIPCGVVSRFPIIASGVVDDPTLTDRDFSFARIDVPGDRDLWVFSMHLIGSSATSRATAADALIDFIEVEVPASDFLVMGGDLNTRSRTETCVQRFSQVVSTSGPFPVDQSGNENTNEPRSEPYDWVLADPDLDPLEVPTRIGSQEFPSGLVLDTRLYQPLSDVAPAEAGDSDAPGMQHMAVIRDFEIPAE
jgi:hypothetical protein